VLAGYRERHCHWREPYHRDMLE
jgi:ELMO domain-containing protein